MGKAVASLNTVRRKGKANVNIIDLEEDEEMEEQRTGHFLVIFRAITGDPENNGKHQFSFLLASQKGNPRGRFLFVSSLNAISQTTQKCAWMKLSDTQARVLTLISAPNTPSGFSNSFCYVNPHFRPTHDTHLYMLSFTETRGRLIPDPSGRIMYDSVDR